MFSNPADPTNCFIDIQAGAGGTEACDWAAMLLRQYLQVLRAQGLQGRGDRREPTATSPASSSATFKIEGDYAFGLLRTETGVHRLVRKSPFDSSGGRHTSFASVFVYPEVDDSIEIEINPADVRIDTFRASGAGGQHINKTDSAVRMTHIPTGIVVQCQNDRTPAPQPRRGVADAEERACTSTRCASSARRSRKLEDTKTDVGWGHQIRSYVLDQSRIKDLRTNVEISNTQKVLDGDLDAFIERQPETGPEILQPETHPMREGPTQPVRREDYTPPAYWIRQVELRFDLDPAKTIVGSKMTIERNRHRSPCSRAPAR